MGHHMKQIHRCPDLQNGWLKCLA